MFTLSMTHRRPGSRGLVLAPLAAIARAAEVARQRRQLATLDATRLADLGLTAEEAQREATRPFWDAPRHWKA